MELFSIGNQYLLEKFNVVFLPNLGIRNKAYSALFLLLQSYKLSLKFSHLNNRLVWKRCEFV